MRSSADNRAIYRTGHAYALRITIWLLISLIVTSIAKLADDVIRYHREGNILGMVLLIAFIVAIITTRVLIRYLYHVVEVAITPRQLYVCTGFRLLVRRPRRILLDGIVRFKLVLDEEYFRLPATIYADPNAIVPAQLYIVHPGRRLKRGRFTTTIKLDLLPESAALLRTLFSRTTAPIAVAATSSGLMSDLIKEHPEIERQRLIVWVRQHYGNG